MFPFSPSVNPVVHSHLGSYVAFLNDVTKSFTGSIQDVYEANLKLSQAIVERGLIATQRMMSSANPTDALQVASAHAQPTAEAMRTYQQRLSQVVAESQVDLSQVMQHHGKETSRTAGELMTEVARAGADEAERAVRQQEGVAQHLRSAMQTAETQATPFKAQGKADKHDHPAAQRPNA